MQETRIQSLGQKNPWRRKWQPTPVFLPRKFHEPKSLAGYTVHGISRSWTWLSTSMIRTILTRGYDIYSLILSPLRCIFPPFLGFYFLFTKQQQYSWWFFVTYFNPVLSFFIFIQVDGLIYERLNLWINGCRDPRRLDVRLEN